MEGGLTQKSLRVSAPNLCSYFSFFNPSHLHNPCSSQKTTQISLPGWAMGQIITGQPRTRSWVSGGGSTSGRTEVLTEYIQWVWFRRVQGNTICGERWLNWQKGLHRQSCVKNSVAPQTASCQDLTLFGFLWVSLPPEFCLEPEGSNGALNSKPNSAPSNHFPLLCFSASFAAFPKARLTQANLGLPQRLLSLN